MIQQLFLCQQGCRNQEELEMEVSVKKGQTYTGVVERVDFPNKGIVVTEELQEDGSSKKVCCVVKNTLPGQRVTFTVNKLRKGKAEGRLLALEEASPMEVESPCPHFGLCGGCIYLTLPLFNLQLFLIRQC